MSEPLVWNQLPAAAAWLSERCGRTLDARAVIDAVIRRSERTAGTIIKAPVPPDCRVARIAFVGHMPDTEQVQFEHQLLEQQHGPLGKRMLYVRNEHPRVHCLCVAELTDLLLHGAIDVSQVHAPNDSKGNTIGAWLMPWGTKRTVSLDACGINRADLVALGDELAAGTPPEETAAEMGARHWQACLDAGLEMPTDTYAQFPRGVTRIAEREGIKRQTFTKRLDAYRAEKFSR